MPGGPIHTPTPPPCISRLPKEKELKNGKEKLGNGKYRKYCKIALKNKRKIKITLIVQQSFSLQFLLIFADYFVLNFENFVLKLSSSVIFIILFVENLFTYLLLLLFEYNMKCIINVK